MPRSRSTRAPLGMTNRKSAARTSPEKTCPSRRKTPVPCRRRVHPPTERRHAFEGNGGAAVRGRDGEFPATGRAEEPGAFTHRQHIRACPAPLRATSRPPAASNATGPAPPPWLEIGEQRNVLAPDRFQHPRRRQRLEQFFDRRTIVLVGRRHDAHRVTDRAVWPGGHRQAVRKIPFILAALAEGWFQLARRGAEREEDSLLALLFRCDEQPGFILGQCGRIRGRAVGEHALDWLEKLFRYSIVTVTVALPGL